MLVSMNEALAPAVREGYAVGSFNVTGFDTLKAIVTAAEQANRPVILSYAQVHSPYLTMEEAAPVMLDFAKRAKVPVCVHLDHGENLDICIQAIRMGFTSVMLDASAEPYEKNAAQTAFLVKVAHAFGVSVEAELGCIGSSSDGYTDPSTASHFVDQTGVDALAIAFGTSHGLYTKAPVLDLDRISAIRERVAVPLVMHGGSGLSKAQFQTAISNGIRKVNYYTYMALAGGKAVKNADAELYHDLCVAARQAMCEDVEKAIRIFALEDRT